MPSSVKTRTIFGGMRAMWVITLFDLPVDTKQNRRNYARFHNYLIDQGFIMLQYSVYAKALPSPERAKVVEEGVIANLPPEGEVRIMTVTESQFARMKLFCKRKRFKPEKQPEQLTFF